MKFTPNQVNELVEIINDFHIMFIAKELGSTVLSDSEIQMLKRSGIDVEKLSKSGKVDDAFRFGILVDALGDKRARRLDYDDFKRFIKEGHFLPLSEAEQETLRYLKTATYSDIKGLGNRVSSDMTRMLIESDKKLRSKYEQAIGKKVDQAVMKRQTVSQLKSDLGHKTLDWSRDLDRIADYTLHSAYDMGKASAILRKTGPEARVYKKVFNKACKHCIELYLTNGLGSRPIIFKLVNLLDNGNNIGRKTSDWLPVVGPTHPFCRCELFEYEGHEWDEEMQDFTRIKRETFGVKRRSKVRTL